MVVVSGKIEKGPTGRHRFQWLRSPESRESFKCPVPYVPRVRSRPGGNAKAWIHGWVHLFPCFIICAVGIAEQCTCCFSLFFCNMITSLFFPPSIHPGHRPPSPAWKMVVVLFPRLGLGKAPVAEDACYFCGSSCTEMFAVRYGAATPRKTGGVKLSAATAGGWQVGV
jgi:hypothetical protein